MLEESTEAAARAVAESEAARALATEEQAKRERIEAEAAEAAAEECAWREDWTHLNAVETCQRVYRRSRSRRHIPALLPGFATAKGSEGSSGDGRAPRGRGTCQSPAL